MITLRESDTGNGHEATLVGGINEDLTLEAIPKPRIGLVVGEMSSIKAASSNEYSQRSLSTKRTQLECISHATRPILGFGMASSMNGRSR
jgi:hypothetical protein